MGGWVEPAEDEPGDWCGSDPEAWRGELHADTAWDEKLAGPMYWMWKDRADKDAADEEDDQC